MKVDIEGTRRIGRYWTIPFDAVKPIDGRENINKEYHGLKYDFSSVDSLKAKIDKYRLFCKELATSLQEKLLIEWAYNSNAIEGSTLTMSETKVVLEGITVGGKTMVEHLETINHRDAILFIEDLGFNKKPISEWNIRNINSLILKEIDNKNTGEFRKENVEISGAKHILPKHYEITDLMQEFIEEYDNNCRDYHPVVKATLLHGEFVKIHPFIDGNGRTARLLLNFELMRNVYTPIIIKRQYRAKYYEVLDIAYTKMNYEPFIKLVSELLVESERLWLCLLD